MRRNFIAGLASTTAAWSVAARAQQPERVRRIGVLVPAAREDTETPTRLTTFQQALQGLGWTDGPNVHIETRFSAAGDAADARKNAAESGHRVEALRCPLMTQSGHHLRPLKW
jgi:putative ABC transport system substrate-binding protein